MRKGLTEAEARQHLIARRKAHAEFERLQDRYWTLRKTMTAESIAAIWLLYGDTMWEGYQPCLSKQSE